MSLALLTEFDAFITWEQMNYATADPPVPPTPDTRSTRTLFRCYEPTFGGPRMITRREDLFAGVHPFEWTADLTGDFTVDIGDVAILSTTFGEAGD